MAKPKANVHRIKIQKKNPDSKITTGANTEILIDGTPIKGVTEATLFLSPSEVGILRLSLVGDIDADLMTDVTGAKVEEP
jgi:hypothetical protein